MFIIILIFIIKFNYFYQNYYDVNLINRKLNNKLVHYAIYMDITNIINM